MIARARLILLLSVVFAIVLLGSKIPLGQLSSESAAAAHYSAQLAQLRAENRSIGAQIKALGTDSEIATIAHGEYGLIHPGQRALVVFPSTGLGTRGTTGPLSESNLPDGDIVPSDLDTAPPAGADGGGSASSDGRGSVFEKVLQRLEFWRWAF
jgi:cell division protein FtsB